MGRVYEDIELHGPRTGLTVNDRRCAYFNQLGVEDVAWLDARAHGGNRDRGAGVRRGGEIYGMVIEALQHRGGNNRRGAGHEGNPPHIVLLGTEHDGELIAIDGRCTQAIAVVLLCAHYGAGEHPSGICCDAGGNTGGEAVFQTGQKVFVLAIGKSHGEVNGRALGHNCFNASGPGE